MKLEKIITLVQANTVRRTLLLAMVRSLRAVGCDLPVWVIPFDEGRFDLPKGCEWWEMAEISTWLKQHRAQPYLRKYQSLTTGNFQFADTDVIFLSNPEKALEAHQGWVVSCNHWRDYHHTVTAESTAWLKQKSTLWHKWVFNSGQYAGEPTLYTPQELMRRAEQPDLCYTCLHSGPDQAGVNALVLASGVNVTNLTLPPYHLESSWVGDYDEDYTRTWKDDAHKPYLLHWAGIVLVVISHPA
jgi:hypothetical protein